MLSKWSKSRPEHLSSSSYGWRPWLFSRVFYFLVTVQLLNKAIWQVDSGSHRLSGYHVSWTLPLYCNGRWAFVSIVQASYRYTSTDKLSSFRTMRHKKNVLRNELDHLIQSYFPLVLLVRGGWASTYIYIYSACFPIPRVKKYGCLFGGTVLVFSDNSAPWEGIIISPFVSSPPGPQLKFVAEMSTSGSQPFLQCRLLVIWCEKKRTHSRFSSVSTPSSSCFNPVVLRVGRVSLKLFHIKMSPRHSPLVNVWL